MDSKRSFFKPVLIQNNIKRFWPAWALHLIVLFFVVIMPVYNMRPESGELSVFESTLDFLKTAYHPVLIFCFAALFALLVFSWMYSARSCNMMHAFPVKRSQLFTANYISGLSFLVIPQAVILLAAMPGCLINGLTAGIMGKIFLLALACDFTFFTIAVLCCMLAGHLLSGLVYILIFNSVYVIMRMLFTTVQYTYGYGIRENVSAISGKGNFLSPIVYITANCEVRYDMRAVTLQEMLASVRIEGGLVLILYCIVSIGILLFALYLYQKRNLECAGEMSAFPAMNPIIRWIVGTCCGLATGFFIGSVIFDHGYTAATFMPMVVLTVIFSLVWFMLSEMVLKKSFRIFRPGIWIEWAVMCALLMSLLGAIKADAFHISSRVPEEKEVYAVFVEGNYEIASKDSEDIQKTIDLQKSFLENQKDYQEAQKRYYEYLDQTNYEKEMETIYLQPVTITYFLKDGDRLERTYYLPLTQEGIQDPSGTTAILTEMETPESAMHMMFGNDDASIHFTEAVFDEKVIDEEGAQEIFAALKKDLEEGNIHYRTEDLLKRTYRDDMWTEDSIRISLTGTADGKYDSGISSVLGKSPYEQPGDGPYSDYGYYYDGSYYFSYGGNNISHAETAYISSRDLTNVSIDFWINAECENTCRVLIKYGLIKDPSDLDRMIKEYNEIYDGVG